MRYLIISVSLLVASLTACGQANTSPNTTANTTKVQTPNQPGNGPPKDPPEVDHRPEPAKPKPPQHEANYVSFEGGLTVWPDAKRAELTAVLLNSQTRALEFLLVGAGGANHEALFQAGCSAEDLKRALEMLGLVEAKVKFMGRGHSSKPTGDRVKVSVKFKHAKTGKITVRPIEDWLLDIRQGKAPENVGFVFTGSHEQFDVEQNRSVVDADLRGNLIALWRDGSCVLDNDRDSGAMPDVYSPNPDADGMPQPTRGGQLLVTLVFEPWKES